MLTIMKKMMLCVALVACMVLCGSPIECYAKDSRQAQKEYGDDIPIEVIEKYNEMKEKYPDAEVSISIEKSNGNLIDAAGSWSGYVTYKGYKMRDYVVTTENAFDMCDVKTGKTTGSFKEAVMLFTAGAAGDAVTKFPFVSAGITLAQYLCDQNEVYEAEAGDKLDATPLYVVKDKMSYVYVGGEAFLGYTTQSVQIKSIAWYACMKFDGKHQEQRTGVVKYPNFVKKSKNYDNPHPKAYKNWQDPASDKGVILKIANGKFAF